MTDRDANDRVIQALLDVVDRLKDELARERRERDAMARAHAADLAAAEATACRDQAPVTVAHPQTTCGGPAPFHPSYYKTLTPQERANLDDMFKKSEDRVRFITVEHGVTCPKVEHKSGGHGHLHAADDDRPYHVDGVSYCGRCHGLLRVQLPPHERANLED